MNWFRKNWYYLVLILFSLTPLLWFVGKGDVIINGLDTNFPLDPIVWFKRRFFVWNDTINAGIDASSSIAGLFFHLLQVIPYSLGFSLKFTEIFSMVFWFSAIVFAGHFFVSSFVKKNKIARLLFVLVYSFNIYLYNTWENIKVSNLALVVGLPLFMGLAIRRNKGDMSTGKFLSLAAIFSVVGSGSGINPAYIITILGGLFFYTLVETIYKKENAKEYLITFASAVGVMVLVNSYWIFPLFRFLFISKSVSGPEDIGFTNWIASLSENTPLLNVLRLQGAWDWYATDQAGFPLYIPYALNYFKNLPFILFSFVYPVLAIISMSFKSKKQVSMYLLLGIMIIFGAFMGAGLHQPTGSLYNLFLQKVPFFSFFRSPWYIFTPYIVLGYAGLIALLYQRLTFYKQFRKLKPFSYNHALLASAVIFTTGHLLYSYPLFTGKIFRPGRYDSFYVSFPEYVIETGKSLDENNKGGRVIMYPDEPLETYSWGYRGTESIISLFSTTEAIAPSFVFGGKVLGSFLKTFYRYLKTGEFESASRMLKYFNVQTMLVKNDSSSTAPKIRNDVGDLERTEIGEWILYEDGAFVDRKIYTANGYYKNSLSDLDYATILPVLNSEYAVIEDGDIVTSKVKDIDKPGNRVLTAESRTIESDPTGSVQIFDLTVEEGIYTIAIEKNGIDSSEINITSQTISFSGSVVRDTESFVLVENVFIPSGNHSITVTYPESVNIVDTDKIKNPVSVLSLRSDELPANSSTLVAYKTGEKEEWIIIPTTNFDPFVNYLFSYNYKYFYGSVPIIDLVQEDEKIIYKVFTNYTGSDSDWAYGSLIINPIEVKSKMSVIIRMPEKNFGGRSKAFFENISIRRINDNKLFLIENKKNEVASPKVSYTKVSPVEYKVEVSEIRDNYTLVFLENYSSDWMIRSDDNIGNPLHFTANGYANAWYIPGNSENQSFTIYYKSQDYYRVGAFISVVTLILLLGSPLILSIYEKRNH